MSDDLEGGMEKKQRDNSGDDEIRPGAARPDYQKCCDDHREVGDRIVAAEQPDRAHVGVSFAETREDERGRHVHDEGGDADPAHQLASWNASVERPPRSEERRVGKECVRTSRSRWSPEHQKTKCEYSTQT